MKALVISALLVLVAGCGGGGDGGDGGSGYDSVEAVTEKMGCERYTPMSKNDVEMFVTEGAECEVDGESMTVSWFKSEKAKDNWLDVASETSGDYILSGKNWIVYGVEKSTLEAVQADIGGEIS